MQLSSRLSCSARLRFPRAAVAQPALGIDECVWHGISLSEGQRPRRLGTVRIADRPTISRGQGAAVEGGALYVRYGCVNCHGPNGLGGVPNPQTPDKTIPPLSGQDFRKEFNTDAKIIAVIRSGSVIGRHRS